MYLPAGYDALVLSAGVALDGAIDGRSGHAEEVAELGDAVLVGVMQRDEMRFLARVELGLLAAQTAFGLGDLHALAGAHPDQVGLELGDHRQHVEQQPADGVGRIVHRRADAELDLAAGEILEDLPRIRQ